MSEHPETELEAGFEILNHNLRAFFGFTIKLTDFLYLEHTISFVSYEILVVSLNRKFDARFPNFDEDSEWAEGDFQEPLVFGAEDVVRSFNFF